MATKNLNTRIQLKYDEHANWITNKAKVLLKGEIGFENVTLADAYGHKVPHVLAKVGDGSKTWEELPYLYANALDVYSWAKKTQDQFVKDLLGLTDDSGVTVEDKLVAAGFTKTSAVTALQAALDNLTERVSTAESKITNLETNSATKEELAAEKENLQADINKKVDQTAYDTKIGEIEDDITSINTTIQGLNNTYATDAELSAAIQGVNNTIAALGDTYATDAELAGVKSELEGKINLKADQSAFNTLSETVAGHTTAIGENTAAIGENAAVIAAIKEDVDAFFKDADLTTNAKDTLKEIQEYINSDAGAAAEMTASIQQNAANIATNATNIAGNTAAIEAEVDRAKAAEKANADNITNIVNGTTVVAKATNAATADNATKFGNQLPSYYATAESVSSANTAISTLDNKVDGIVEDVKDGTIIAAKATNADKLGGVAAANYALKTDVTNAINALDSTVTVSADTTDKFQVVTGVSQTDGKLTSVAEVSLHKIAKSGNVNDLVQTDGDYIIFNCGSATELI